MRRHAGCICPPEFTGEHCELLDYHGFDPSSHHRAKNQKKSSNSTAVPVAFVSIGSLCVALGVFMLYRKRQYYFHRSSIFDHHEESLAHSTQPPPPPPLRYEPSPFYTEDPYTDDEFADSCIRDAPDSDDDYGEFHDILPEIS